MGNVCKIKMSSEHLEIKSPIFGCIIEHCKSSCMKEQEQQSPQSQPEPENKTDIIDVVITNNEPKLNDKPIEPENR